MNSPMPLRSMPEMADETHMRFVMEVYERGQTVEALRRAEQFKPLKDWRGVSQCVLAARIAVNAGAPRLSMRLGARAYRTDPNNPDGRVQYAYEVVGCRGALALWRMMRHWPDCAEATPVQQAELLAIQGGVASDLRDFSRAEQLLDQAEALDPKRTWIRIQRSRLLEAQDRVEEALEMARAACALHPHPFYRVGVQVVAQLLQSLDRDEEAIQLLSEADVVLQSGPVAAQLYGLLSESGRWAEAEKALARYQELSPLLEAPLRKWLESQRARVAYRLGRRSEAAQLAGQLEDDFNKEFAARLAVSPVPNERVQLNVSFVRQHFKTCAPATLAALGRFWRMPAEHLKLAESMCYDGTPSWQQRDWAEKNGWLVREFRVTWESVVPLIERGIPFAMSTVEATSAHMTAVVGFDRVRNTLFLRDPGQPYVIEVPVQPFLKRYEAFGPHGMVFVPTEEGARLSAVELPDTELYDGYHAFWLALAKHDRPGAEAALWRMESVSNDAMLTWEARSDLAAYDANVAEQVRCLDRLLELYPGNAARLLRKLNCLQSASRETRVNFLKPECEKKDAEPALFVALARTLGGDARAQPEASRWLRRALRRRPMDSSAMSVLADSSWEIGNLAEATAIYRFAANLEGFRENLYQSWFVACRHTRSANEAMAHLQDRFTRFGAKSEQPALTLAWAWREMEQPARAREVLDEAMQRRPEDGYLRLRAASLLARLGEKDRADALLQSVRGRVRENDWLRMRVELAMNRFDYETVLTVARELLEREPLALDTHSRLAEALSLRQGSQAAIDHLQAASLRFPYHYGLRRMLVDWIRETIPQAYEAAARALVTLEPSDAWARRELALALSRVQRNEEALQEASEGARIEPRNTYSHSVLAHIQYQLGHTEAARTAYREAVAFSVDNTHAIHALLEFARTDVERKQELAFVERELVNQVVSGDGLLVYLELARPILAPEVLLNGLQLAHRERPDLWHAWSALISQLGHMGRLDEALALVRQATERFGHLPRIWIDVVMVHRWRKEMEEEIAAARQAVEMNPSWARTALLLTNALERCGRLDEARQVCERALHHVPQDAQLHATLASLLWRQQQGDAAFAAIERALRLVPAYEYAWDLLFEWAEQCGQSQRVRDFARVLVKERPGEARVWLMLARILTERQETGERLTAVNRALELDGRLTDAWDLKAQFLALAERFEESLAAIKEGTERCPVDIYILNGRRAWVEAHRRRLPEAVQLMRAVLTENASYVWGWHQLALWLIELERLPEATKALEQLQRLRPHDAWVNRQLGVLRLRQKDRDGARAEFAAAVKSSPTDVNAAHNLLGLQLDAGEVSAASDTIRVMKAHQPGAVTDAAEVSLQLRMAEFEKAGRGLETIAISRDPDPWPLNAATDAFQKAGLAPKALKVLRRAIKSEDGNPEVGAAAIKLLLAEGDVLAAVWLYLRLKPGEMQRRAVIPLLDNLATHKRSLLLRWVMWRRREVLYQDDVAWGKVGFALSNINQMREVSGWLSNWRDRSKVQPWMLFNLCLALRHEGRYAESTTVARYVVETWGHREGSADMHLFLAIEDALAGLVADAKKHLEQVAVRTDVTYDQQILGLTKALVEFHETPQSARLDGFPKIRRQLAPHFGEWHLLKSMKDVRRTFARTRRVFWDGGAGASATGWFIWKQYWQWVLLPVTPLLFLLAIQPPVLCGLIIWRLTAKRRQ